MLKVVLIFFKNILFFYRMFSKPFLFVFIKQFLMRMDHFSSIFFSELEKKFKIVFYRI